MINNDIKTGTIIGKPVEQSKLVEYTLKAWDAFHKYGLWLTFACAIGVYIGISASKMYYTSKMEECVKIGGIVYKEKVYLITQK